MKKEKTKEQKLDLRRFREIMEILLQSRNKKKGCKTNPNSGCYKWC